MLLITNLRINRISLVNKPGLKLTLYNWQFRYDNPLVRNSAKLSD